MCAENGLEFLARVFKAGQAELNRLRAEIDLSKSAEIYFPHSEHILPQDEAGELFIQKEKIECRNYGGDNRLFAGDNLAIMLALLKGDKQTGLPSLQGQIDLIYIDPPFATQRKYRATIKHGGQELMREAYSDKWDLETGEYLKMLLVRLGLMRELLKQTGSIMVHLDWHFSHYVKILLDELFGSENFRNEIVWCYGGGGAPKKHYPRKHDVILWYSKSDKWVFNKQYRPYSSGTLSRGLTAVKGERYSLNQKGAGLNDWWADKAVQKILSPTAYENLKYATQKPESLMQRIILGHSNPGDIVADFFAGSGTTAAVANRTNRRWIAVDEGKAALSIMRRRLRSNSGRAFWIHNLSTDLHESAELQDSHIKIKIMRTAEIDDYERVLIELLGYEPEVDRKLEISREEQKKILTMQQQDSLALVEYWSIAPDYNGEVFYSQWQAWRGFRSKKAGSGKITSQAEFLLIKKPFRKLAVKIIDIWGNEKINVFTFRSRQG